MKNIMKAVVPPASLTLLVALTLPMVSAIAQEKHYQVGLSKVDVTPEYPIRLNGFGFRREESEGVSQSIFAKALAISEDGQSPVVTVTVDNLGLRWRQTEAIAARLKESHQLPRENFVLTFTHTHCAPKVNGSSDNIFSEAIPQDHQQHIDQYTEELLDRITAAARQAIDNRRASTLHWGVGNVGFAKNRRTAGGPVDHDLPTLLVRDAQTRQIRGVYVSYACHCVTLRFNRISGDWAGYAADLIERQFPGSIAMVSIGTGSDQNPSEVSPDDVSVAQRQGNEIAAEVKRLSSLELKPLEGSPLAKLNTIDLPLKEVPSREQLAEIEKNGSRATDRYNATTQIARLDRGEALPSRIEYAIQTIAFGESLCMTFLAGEVCADYGLRLKSELDRDRLWVHGYSNDFCCYIPSERLLKEGGYGGGGEIPYFALPSTLAEGLEQRIVDEVHRQVPEPFKTPKLSGTFGIATVARRIDARDEDA
ncbi:MAG: neutral/alkaline non-lysosomal ceramidase N-terminal domain-containing protein [Pirellulaceae bacterium]